MQVFLIVLLQSTYKDKIRVVCSVDMPLWAIPRLSNDGVDMLRYGPVSLSCEAEYNQYTVQRTVVLWPEQFAQRI